MVKRILFVCKHNIFRSRVAEELFKKLIRKKNYKARSAGVIRWDKRDLRKDGSFEAEKRVAKKKGIKLSVKSRGLSSSLLKDTDIVVIVADDVSFEIFKDKSFGGKLISWKIPDVKDEDKNKEKAALEIILLIEEKIKKFVRRLR
ncbi:MAG: hypothetical protein KKC19_02305 [Nanoarchaeota archaeon]|nr:hypothetical protein [Nanoarchaeota archaeon]